LCIDDFGAALRCDGALRVMGRALTAPARHRLSGGTNRGGGALALPPAVLSALSHLLWLLECAVVASSSSSGGGGAGEHSGRRAPLTKKRSPR
jgi:hypothetical protein